MITIDIYSRTPIYQQVIDGVKSDVLHGWLKDGEMVTSIRELSVEVGINPNTVAKAYAELERTGILSVVPGKGYFVTNGAAERMKEALISQEKQNFFATVEKLMQNGVSRIQIDCWVQEIIDARKNEK